MALHKRLHNPFRFSATSLSTSNAWDCTIDGRPFRMDRQSDAFEQGMQSLSVLREQSDTSAKPGEASINREDLWRSSSSSWHKGAGQRYRDKDDSDPDRFWASTGLDVWKRDELSLLNGTEKLRAGAANSLVLNAGGYLYVADGATIVRYDGTTFASTTISSASQPIISMATDGFHLWALTASATFQTNTGTTAWTTWITGSYDKVAYARGRVLVTKNQNVFEVQSTTATSLNASEGNTALRWSAIAEGNTAIYAASVSGNRSQIYRIVPPTDDAGGNLGVPVPAAPALPTGEVVRALYGYLGQLVIGTDKGFRVAEEDGNGNLNIGALIKTPAPVSAFDGEGSFVWFAYSDFDDTSSGLGRIDLSQLVDVGIYAYASDLMAGITGTVASVASFNGRRYFTITGQGLFGETDDFVESGWLETGLIRYDVIDPKVAERVELRHRKLSGSVSVALSADENTFSTLGTSDLEGTVTPTIPFDAVNINGSNFNLRVQLNKGVTGSPILQTVELRSAVVPSRGMSFLVPVVLAEDDQMFPARHPSEDYEALAALVRYRRSIPYVELGKSFNVIIQDFQFVRHNRTQDDKWWNGTMILKLMAPAA